MATKPAEHKIVQARILRYAQEIGLGLRAACRAPCAVRRAPCAEGEARQGFDPAGATPEEWARKGARDHPCALYSGAYLLKNRRKP